MNELSYCGEQVREHDRDRFLLSLFAPKPAQEHLWALFAFNHEIAKTREVVSDTTLGRIRLQWWMDAITDLYEKGFVLEHEVLKPLAAAIQKYNLPRAEFETLIAARALDLEEAPITLDAFLNYADGTSTPLMALAVRITGDDPDLEPVQAVAMNYAIAGLLRASVYRPGFVPGEGRDVAAHFVSRIKTRNRFLKASQKLASLYMGQMRRADYDLKSPAIQQPLRFKELCVLLG